MSSKRTKKMKNWKLATVIGKKKVTQFSFILGFCFVTSSINVQISVPVQLAFESSFLVIACNIISTTENRFFTAASRNHLTSFYSISLWDSEVVNYNIATHKQ